MDRTILNVEEMEACGAEWARSVVGGEIFALVGSLGAGKTHWTKGFARGLGYEGEVTSPTFGLVHEYRAGRLPVFHLDFYRLESVEDLLALGWDEMLEECGVVVAEWGDRFSEMLPEHTRWLHLEVLPGGYRRLVERGPQ
ncbi:MAG: tRNA (adenosine(37)-N6)-threonylcarbamoyltransferase complex ATPase subunit type 1 TsaE [Verrucomicrobiales bacterium]